MTLEIVLLLVILGAAVLFFVSGWLRVDLVALLVLSSLALTGLATPSEALAGFSNPAVVTVWAVFILGGGLLRTGVAGMLGSRILRIAGSGELGLLLAVMLTAGFLSAFMNNVGVAALLLPVLMDIARRTGRPPSRLLMPLAFGALLGGLTTLVGTPPNILVTDALRQRGFAPFSLFDFTPVGLAVMLSGIAFMSLVGRHLLPSRRSEEGNSTKKEMEDRYLVSLKNQLFFIRLPGNTLMKGRTLTESRLGAGAGLNVIALVRGGRTLHTPDGETVLQGMDCLIVAGKPDQLLELQGNRFLIKEKDHLPLETLISGDIGWAEATFEPGSGYTGLSLRDMNFRRRYGVNVVGIFRKERLIRTYLTDMPLKEGDALLVIGPRRKIEDLHGQAELRVWKTDKNYIPLLLERLMFLRVPADSSLVGKTVSQSRLGDALDLSVIAIYREGNTFVPGDEEKFQAQDRLLVEGRQENLETLQALQELELEKARLADLPDLESGEAGFMEAILSPRTSLAGKSLRDLHFREKYGLNVVGLFRQGRFLTENLREEPLRLGDGILLHGPWERMKVLGSEPDFVVLTARAEEPPRLKKAPLAVLAMAVFVVPVIFGWVPVHIGAVTAAALTVVFGCLTMDEAYWAINWKAVFLIAGMLPLGVVIEKTGAAQLLSREVLAVMGDFGPRGMIAGVYIITSLCAQVMPTSAVAILIAPIAMDMALEMNLYPHALMMTVAMSSSASFMSPVAHPANVLVMGPGGYRFIDYTKVGVPLTAVCLLVVLFVLPLFWPLSP